MKKNTSYEGIVLSQEEVKAIKKDRLRFSKNKIPSSLTLLAILVNVFYFVSIYKTNLQQYYKPAIGISVLYNLMFMLFSFLSAEGIKNYKKTYGIVLIVIGLLQLLRIVYFPLKGITTPVSEVSTAKVMEVGQFIRTLIYLIGSGALLIVAGVIGYIKSVSLEKYRKEIGEEKPS